MLSKELLKGLDAHKYSCNGKSLTEPLFQIYWTWLVQLMPMWVAPNLLTFVGLLCNILGSCALLWYTPGLTEPAPWWAYITVAASLFVYQSLDAIDGKQARRTNSSSPLGELFDHGCDALSGVLLSLCSLSVLRAGNMPVMLHMSLLLAVSVFYSAHWRAYTGGTLEFGLIDVTEAQGIMIITQLVAVIAGPDFVLTEIFGGYTIAFIMLCIINMTAWYVLISNCIMAVRCRHSGHCSEDRWYTPIVPFAILIASTLLVFFTSPGNIGVVEPALFGLFYGCIAAQLSSRLVVAHMSKTPMALFDFCLVPILCMLVNSVLGAPLPEHYAAAAGTIVAAVNLFATASIMCREIAQHMSIYVFSISKRLE